MNTITIGGVSVDTLALVGFGLGFLIAAFCFQIGVLVGENRELERARELRQRARPPIPFSDDDTIEHTGTVGKFRRA